MLEKAIITRREAAAEEEEEEGEVGGTRGKGDTTEMVRAGVGEEVVNTAALALSLATVRGEEAPSLYSVCLHV